MQQRSEETRTRILTAAESLFALNGYDATGVADICSEANVSKGAFYHHFPSKQAIFQALLEQWLSQLDTQLIANLNEASDVPEGLVAMASQTDVIFEGARTRASIFLEFWMQAMRHPDVWKSVVSPYHRYLDQFADILKKGIAEGSLDENQDPHHSARMLIALALGMLLQAFFDPDTVKWDQVTQSGIQCLVEGLRKK